MSLGLLCASHNFVYVFNLIFLYKLPIIMAANREPVDDIFGDSHEEKFVGFSREELGIDSVVEVQKYDEDDDGDDEIAE